MVALNVGFEMSKAFATFCDLHYQNTQGLRLGQRFCNIYIKQPYPNLYYAQDEEARHMIRNWLEDNHYFEKLPKEIQKC